jgi:hypothetical protein
MDKPIAQKTACICLCFPKVLPVLFAVAALAAVVTALIQGVLHQMLQEGVLSLSQLQSN